MPRRRKGGKNGSKTGVVLGKGTGAFQSVPVEPNQYIEPMATDGNCVFRCIADQVERDDSKHPLYRKAIEDFIQSQPQLFQAMCTQPLSRYCARMRNLGVWGDHLELAAAGYLLRADIVVYSTAGSQTVFSLDHRVDSHLAGHPRRTVRVSYHGGSHYNSVRETGIEFGLGSHGDGPFVPTEPGSLSLSPSASSLPSSVSSLFGPSSSACAVGSTWVAEQPQLGCPLRHWLPSVLFTATQYAIWLSVALYCATLVYLAWLPVQCDPLASSTGICAPLTVQRYLETGVKAPTPDYDYSDYCEVSWRALNAVVKDAFFVIHFVAWMWIALVTRDAWMCHLCGAWHEVIELSFGSVLSNLKECWFDISMDLFLCNNFGIIIGAWVAYKMFGPLAEDQKMTRPWNARLPVTASVSFSPAPSNKLTATRARVRRRAGLPAAPPSSFSSFPSVSLHWHGWPVLKSWLTVWGLLAVYLVLETMAFLNRFLIKRALWLPTTHILFAVTSTIMKGLQWTWFARRDIIPGVGLILFEFVFSWRLLAWGSMSESGMEPLPSSYVTFATRVLPSDRLSREIGVGLLAVLGVATVLWSAPWRSRSPIGFRSVPGGVWQKH